MPASKGLEYFDKKLVFYCCCNKILQSDSLKQLWHMKLKTMGTWGWTPLRSPLVCRYFSSIPLPELLALSQPGNPQTTLGREAGMLTADLHFSLHYSKFNPHSLILNCSRLPTGASLLPSWSRVNYRDLILLTSCFILLALPNHPTPTGTSWDPTGHSEQGSK